MNNLNNLNNYNDFIKKHNTVTINEEATTANVGSYNSGMGDTFFCLMFREFGWCRKYFGRFSSN